jgi:predicted tellurium resistance membrane protein TerC
MFDWLFDPAKLVAVLTLTALELVLGIDNVVFIAILAGKLPPRLRDRVRLVGLVLAAGGRIGLLFSVAWIMGLTVDAFTFFGRGLSWRDLILMAGGLFLLYKAVTELHQSVEGDIDAKGAAIQNAGVTTVLLQIVALDVVFALDSIVAAVGMARDLQTMSAAIVLSVILMMAVSGQVHRFVTRHPTIKLLALSFLLMIGLVLILEGLRVEVPKSSVYFAMGFAVFVELLNIRFRKVRQKPVALHEPYVGTDAPRNLH